MFIALSFLFSFLLLGRCADPGRHDPFVSSNSHRFLLGWVSLNITVAQNMTDTDYLWSQVRVLIGTPPQPVDLTLNMGGYLFATWSSDCLYCPGSTPFDMSSSSTLEPNNAAWAGNSVDGSGMWHHDTVSFGGVLTNSDIDFVSLQYMSTKFDPRLLNGVLGLSVDLLQSGYPNILTKMWEADTLMNPVVGVRLDPLKPRITIGALDPKDYVGEINWVETSPGGFISPRFEIDGLKGYNGSFIPFGVDNLVTSISSLVSNIYVPPSNPYALGAGYTGPVHSINIYPEGGFAFNCNYTAPNLSMSYVSLTVTINGVDYPMDSAYNMIRPPSMSSAPDYCNVALSNTTAADDVDVVLGLPFLRSVYLAYRFPTDNCPGYYGFAFPSGANRTQDQINQKPTSAPSLSSQCLILSQPTSTPSVSSPSSDSNKKDLGTSAFEIYGGDGEQVPLLGAEDLKRVVWNKTLT
ncbi:acid protease [Pluteus cervinus]|uniref:Acid protease n=1 Tax=Pluteus cervinus TaxID=181527 RepID=A0ACD3A6B3_9AGAR|nr:acid protease [Pluteus cervinus]